MTGLLIVLIFALAFAESPCGAGARFANLLGTYFCLYEGFNTSIPLDSYCYYVNDGYIGYTFSSSRYPDYQCVKGSRQTGDYCLFEQLNLIPSFYTHGQVEPFCNFVQQGVIGYAWTFDQSKLVSQVFGASSPLASVSRSHRRAPMAVDSHLKK